MEEIEVGEYVRTNDGIIGKITDIDICEICEEKTYIISINYQRKISHKNNITKHSKNIIDLIEVGDYVNGKCCIDIEEIKTDDGRRNLNLVCIGGSILELSDEIKSILTKEQYENNCYRLEER